MPRGYDSYLMGSLCQSESDGEPVRNVTESTPARRPSLSDALPRIPIKLEGCGVSITLKAGPHVRWTKVLAKWSACFPSQASAPLAWPVVATVGETRIPISSIQESISRSIGPELLAAVSDDDPAIIVTVGQADREDVVEDVVPPQATATEAEPVVSEPGPSTVEPVPQDAVEEVVDKKSRSVKIVIESKLVGKRIKLNVSSGCAVERLIRKWLEASKSTINAELVDLVYNEEVLERTKSLHDVLPEDTPVDQRVELRADLNVEASPKRKRSKRDSLPTPPTAVPAATRSTSSTTEDDWRRKEQEGELLYWQQRREAEKEGLRDFVDDESEEWVDDDEALAIALSLSELPQSSASLDPSN